MSSLTTLDLEKMVSANFGVDIYSAKTGSDADVCVLSFRVKSELAANDLATFLEKEGGWILDCDASTGEDNTGKYLVFVEIKRNSRLCDRIMELLDIMERLTSTVRWQFSVGKKLTTHVVKLSTLEQFIPSTPEEYEKSKQAHRTEEMIEFFSSAPFNTVVLENDQLSLQQFFMPHRMHSSVNFTVVNESPNIENLDESVFDTLSSSTASWVGRILGPNIQVQEAGPNLLLTNTNLNKSLLVTLNV